MGAGLRDAMNLSLEARRRARRRPARAGARHLRGRTQAARPRHDPAGQAHRHGDDRGRRSWATCSAALVAPRLHLVPGLAAASWTARRPRCSRSELVVGAGCGAPSPAGSARTRCWPTAAGSTTWPAAGSPSSPRPARHRTNGPRSTGAAPSSSRPTRAARCTAGSAADTPRRRRPARRHRAAGRPRSLRALRRPAGLRCRPRARHVPRGSGVDAGRPDLSSSSE